MLPVQESPYLHYDDRALADAWRDGDLNAATRLIERHQHELLRIAFLLSSRDVIATDLVSAAMLAFFSAAQRSATSPDIRTALIAELGRHYFALGGGQSGAGANSIVATVDRDHYNVDNERTRLRNALATLPAAGRVAVVLADLAHLPEPVVRDVSGLTSLEIDDQRQRLRFIAGLDDATTLYGPLAAGAMDAPRVDLRDAVTDELRARQRAAWGRARLINVGAVVATVAVAAALIWFLLGFGDPSRSDTVDDAENLARNPSSQPALGGAAPGANPTPMAPPTATPLPTPPADVPNILLVRQEAPAGQVTQLIRFSSDVHQVLALQGPGEFQETGEPVIAPDGEQIMMLWYRYIDGEVRAVITAHDGDLKRSEWVAEVAARPFEPSPGARPPIFLTGAVDDERAYVAVHPWESSDPVEIIVLRREDGAIEKRIVTTVSGFVVHSLRVFAPPGHNVVYLFAISQDEPPQYGDLQMIFMAYSVPAGERVHGRTLADKPDSRAFFLYESRLTPDNDYLYGVDYTNATGELAVHFLNLPAGRLEPRLLLPFEPVADPLPYQQVASHDGRWLYVLSPASRQVAVVDLINRELTGVVPLNMGGNYAGATVATSYFPSRQMQLSPDGRTLYALGAGVSPGTSPSGIWVIDVPTWTLSEIWIPDIPVARLIVFGEHELYASLPPNIELDDADQPASSVHLASFETFSENAPDALETLASLYRQVYGRSPSVEGRAPGVASDFYPSATMSVVVDDLRLEPGERAEIDVRFVNPLTDVPVFEGPDESGTRYTPPDGVRAVLTSAGEEILLELGKASYGWYRGSVVLPSAGEWNLTLIARWSGDVPDQRRLTYPSPIQVQGLVGGFPGSALGIRAK